MMSRAREGRGLYVFLEGAVFFLVRFNARLLCLRALVKNGCKQRTQQGIDLVDEDSAYAASDERKHG